MMTDKIIKWYSWESAVGVGIGLAGLGIFLACLGIMLYYLTHLS
jgi:hypothetical protein